METWIVGGILVAIVALVIRKMVMDKKSGKTACACGGDCSRCKGCH